jgi:hypothetical protein
MGDWYFGPDPERPGRMKWLYDKDAPRAGVEATHLQPAVAPPQRQVLPREVIELFDREDGTYGRIDPSWFVSCDEVDSRDVESVGAPEEQQW